MLLFRPDSLKLPAVLIGQSHLFDVTCTLSFDTDIFEVDSMTAGKQYLSWTIIFAPFSNICVKYFFMLPALEHVFIRHCCCCNLEIAQTAFQRETI